jgi:hypothetical protein
MGGTIEKIKNIHKLKNNILSIVFDGAALSPNSELCPQLLPNCFADKCATLTEMLRSYTIGLLFNFE